MISIGPGLYITFVGLTMTPAIELRNTEYAERYDVKLLLLLRRFQGNMQSPTIAAMYPPRRIFYAKQSLNKLIVTGNKSGTHNETGAQRRQITTRTDRVG